MHADSQPTRGTRQARLLALIAVAVAALGAGAIGAVSLGAAFTDRASVDAQQVATATVDIEAGVAAASTPINATNLLPGDTVSTNLEISNAGSADVYYTVSFELGDGHSAALSDALSVAVTVGGVTETRSLASWATGALQIAAPLASGTATNAQVSVSLPYGAPNTLQGTATEFSVVVEAIQAQNTPAPTAGWVQE